MNTLAIYDSTGKIYLTLYGETQLPQGLQSTFVDIPDGMILDGINMKSPDPHPIFKHLPGADVGHLQKVAKG